MKIEKTENTTRVWLSQRDTWRWSHRPNAQWPCSTISDKRVFVELSPNGDLVDIKVNGKDPKNDIDAHELKDCLDDLTRGK